MADLCCNNVARNPTADKGEAKDPHGHPEGKLSDAEHSPTHPHRHRLEVTDQVENQTSVHAANLRRCLANTAAIPFSELSRLKMPDVPKV